MSAKGMTGQEVGGDSKKRNTAYKGQSCGEPWSSAPWREAAQDKIDDLHCTSLARDVGEAWLSIL